MRAIAAIAALAGLAGASGGAAQPVELPSWRGPSLAHQRQLLQQAQAFMDDYARRLLAGDRAAIASLYDPDGAILIRNGQRTYASHDEIVRRYAGAGWRPPADFHWRDLHFEAAGPESVVVLGAFEWRDESGPPVIGTYHALLRREAGRLLIHIEDETFSRSAAECRFATQNLKNAG